jgi:hypothetical protein
MPIFESTHHILFDESSVLYIHRIKGDEDCTTFAEHLCDYNFSKSPHKTSLATADFVNNLYLNIDGDIFLRITQEVLKILDVKYKDDINKFFRDSEIGKYMVQKCIDSRLATAEELFVFCPNTGGKLIKEQSGRMGLNAMLGGSQLSLAITETPTTSSVASQVDNMACTEWFDSPLSALTANSPLYRLLYDPTQNPVDLENCFKEIIRNAKHDKEQKTGKRTKTLNTNIPIKETLSRIRKKGGKTREFLTNRLREIGCELTEYKGVLKIGVSDLDQFIAYLQSKWDSLYAASPEFEETGNAGAPVNPDEEGSLLTGPTLQSGTYGTLDTSRNPLLPEELPEELLKESYDKNKKILEKLMVSFAKRCEFLTNDADDDKLTRYQNLLDRGNIKMEEIEAVARINTHRHASGCMRFASVFFPWGETTSTRELRALRANYKSDSPSI